MDKKLNTVLDCGRLEKVFLCDEMHFFVLRKHSRHTRIRKGEQLSPANINEVVKHH